jgi:cation:H+ antiporter
MILDLLLLFGGFVPVILGARWFVEGSATVARSLKVPPMAIGLTLVAFGTSMPELVVNITAALQQRGAMVLGNVAGSNIFNILLILGAAALFSRLPINRKTTWIEIPLALAAAAALLAVSGDPLLDGRVAEISRSEGLLLLLFFGVFMGYVISLLQSETEPPETLLLHSDTPLPTAFAGSATAEGRRSGGDTSRLFAPFAIAIGGAAVLIAGAQAVVIGAEGTALRLGMSERLVAVTIIAAGTSLPELVTSITAARKGETDIAVGNVVGSCIFNIFLVLGLSAVIFPIRVVSGAALDLVVNFGTTLLLFLFVFTGRGRAVERWEGILFLLVFAGFIAVSIV